MPLGNRPSRRDRASAGGALAVHSDVAATLLEKKSNIHVKVVSCLSPDYLPGQSKMTARPQCAQIFSVLLELLFKIPNLILLIRFYHLNIVESKVQKSVPMLSVTEKFFAQVHSLEFKCFIAAVAKWGISAAHCCEER